MESTIVKTVARTANLRRWLHRPESPEAIRQLKVLFDKCFVPANAPQVSDDFVQREGPRRAYFKRGGVIFSPVGTHIGNANIIYRPSPSESPVAGQIQLIQNIHGLSGKNTDVCLHVRRYNPVSKALYDPFLRYPYFMAKTYSSTLSEKVDIVDIDDIIAHAARFDYSHGRSVLVNLSRN